MEKEMNFETALERLEKIVEELESGEPSLDESLKLFEEGVKISRFCSGKLEKAEGRIRMLMEDGTEKEFTPGEAEDEE